MGTTLGGGAATSAGGEHAWFRAHLANHLLDLLPDADRERFARHAGDCAACAKFLAAARAMHADWWDGAGHIPVEVLHQLRGSLPPAPSGSLELARRHLSACESCRSDLAVLNGEVAHSEAGLPGSPGPRERRGLPHTWRGWGWSLAGAAGAIVTAGALLLIRTGGPGSGAIAPRLAPPPVAPVESAPTPAASAPASEVAGTVPAAVAGPFAVLAAERSAATGQTSITIPASASIVALTLPALYLSDEIVLSIELRTSDGAVVFQRHLAAARALRPGGLRLPTAGLASGRYVLHVSPGPTPRSARARATSPFH